MICSLTKLFHSRPGRKSENKKLNKPLKTRKSTRRRKPRSIKLYKTRTLVLNLQNLREGTEALPLGRE